MAGGTGSRFWPMSQADNPKQFLDIMGVNRSMLQITFRRFERVCPRENIYIVTGSEYVDRVHEQIPGLDPRQVLGEPVRRNTAPCIAYAAAMIGCSNPEARIVVTPADHAIFNEENFIRDIERALHIGSRCDGLVTIGIHPTYPNTGYGYIQFSEEPVVQCSNGTLSERVDMPTLHRVVTFTEKPPLEMAQQFIATDEFLWNSGIVVCRLQVLKQAFERHLPVIAQEFFRMTRSTTAEEVEYIYSRSESISIDFGIMEKAEEVYVLEASFGWSDVESWETLHDTVYRMGGADSNGNCIVSGNVFSYELKDTIVHVPNTRTLVLQGLEGYIVAGNEDTLLVCRRDHEDLIVKYASDVDLAEAKTKK